MIKKTLPLFFLIFMISLVWGQETSLYMPVQGEIPDGYIYYIEDKDKQEFGIESNPGYMGEKGLDSLGSKILGKPYKGIISSIFIVSLGIPNTQKSEMGCVVFSFKDKEALESNAAAIFKSLSPDQAVALRWEKDLVILASDEASTFPIIQAWASRLKDRLLKDKKIELKDVEIPKEEQNDNPDEETPPNKEED